MLLRQIKSESYGVLRYKPFRPSLSAKNMRNLLIFSGFLSFCKNCSPLLLPLSLLRLFKCFFRKRLKMPFFTVFVCLCRRLSIVLHFINEF